MKTRKLHGWNLSYRQASQLQEQLAGKVRFAAIKVAPKLIAGLDCALSKDGQRIFASVVVLKQANFELVETCSAACKLTFPYVPGLLSFREGPVCIAAVEKLKAQPDVFLIAGQGVAHPRRLGLASHLGLFFNKPTIGCAKSRLIGSFEEPASEKGAYSLLTDKKSTLRRGKAAATKEGEVIGAVVRTRSNVKPLFVSVGNRVTLEEAIRITLACTGRYRLPEPTRLAHQLADKLKKS